MITNKNVYKVITFMALLSASSVSQAMEDTECLDNRFAGRFLIKNNETEKFLSVVDPEVAGKHKVAKVSKYIGEESIFTFENRPQQGWLLKAFDSSNVYICEFDKWGSDRRVKACEVVHKGCFFNIIPSDNEYILESNLLKDYMYFQKKGELALADGIQTNQSKFSFIPYTQNWFDEKPKNKKASLGESQENTLNVIFAGSFSMK